MKRACPGKTSVVVVGAHALSARPTFISSPRIATVRTRTLPHPTLCGRDVRRTLPHPTRSACFARDIRRTLPHPTYSACCRQRHRTHASSIRRAARAAVVTSDARFRIRRTARAAVVDVRSWLLLRPRLWADGICSRRRSARGLPARNAHARTVHTRRACAPSSFFDRKCEFRSFRPSFFGFDPKVRRKRVKRA